MGNKSVLSKNPINPKIHRNYVSEFKIQNIVYWWVNQRLLCQQVTYYSNYNVKWTIFCFCFSKCNSICGIFFKNFITYLMFCTLNALNNKIIIIVIRKMNRWIILKTDKSIQIKIRIYKKCRISNFGDPKIRILDPRQIRIRPITNWMSGPKYSSRDP